ETLGLFLYRYCLLDATEIVMENGEQLVKAAVGRIKIFSGTARTVLDEPFVLTAAFNYFREKDPPLVSAAELAMLHSNNPSVHGIYGNTYPVFVQLKLRQVHEGSDVEKAPATVSSHAMQEKMEKEQVKMRKEQQKQRQPDSTACIQSIHQQPPRLQDYCPTGIYISMVVTYPAEVVKFQVVRPNPEPELEGLQRVSIDIDDNNFAKIFPPRHVEFLDMLKGHKRRSEDQDDEQKQSKKIRGDTNST
ncbi:hypothetical protein BGZ58_004170, partial [Dissophora ornata]